MRSQPASQPSRLHCIASGRPPSCSCHRATARALALSAPGGGGRGLTDSQSWPHARWRCAGAEKQSEEWSKERAQHQRDMDASQKQQAALQERVRTSSPCLDAASCTPTHVACAATAPGVDGQAGRFCIFDNAPLQMTKMPRSTDKNAPCGRRSTSWWRCSTR